MVLPGGLTPFEKTVPPEIFYFCLRSAIKDGKCSYCHDEIMWSFEENPMLRRILASKDKIYYKRIENTST